MERPTISIAIITYQHERYIADAVRSALAQDADEIIVVDDGSHDGTAAVAGSFADPRLQVVVKSNGGPSSALNAAIDHTRGDILIPFSGDDILLPGSAHRRAQILALSGADFIWSAPRFIGDDGQEIGGGELAETFSTPASLRPLDVFRELWLVGNFVSAASVAMTRRMWETVGRFDEQLWQLQDYDYWMRASALGMEMLVGREPYAAYRIHGSNLSTSNASRLDDELNKTMSTALRWLDQPQLIELLFGIAEFESPLSREAAAALLYFTHSRKYVSDVGRVMLARQLSTGSTFDPLKCAITPGVVVGAGSEAIGGRAMAGR